MATTADLLANIEAAKAAYLAAASDREEVWRPLSNAVQEAQAALVAAIVDGALPCPKCKGVVTGTPHPRGFFIGCAVCVNHRAFGPSLATAKAAWNEGCADYEASNYAKVTSETGHLPTGWWK